MESLGLNCIARRERGRLHDVDSTLHVRHAGLAGDGRRLRELRPAQGRSVLGSAIARVRPPRASRFRNRDDAVRGKLRGAGRAGGEARVASRSAGTRAFRCVSQISMERKATGECWVPHALEFASWD